jgi:hypothetical protein
MIEIAPALNRFASAQQVDSVSSDDPILEIPLSEFQHVLEDLVSVYNQIAEIAKDAGILRGRELARLTEDHVRALKAEKSPTTKLLLINAYVRQLLTKIHEALKSRPVEGGKVVQVCTKIAARAIKIIEYVRNIAQDSPRKEIALDSSQARILFSGASGEPVSRRDTIRAMRRAEVLWPALQCNHRANDGRRTMRLTARMDELKELPHRDLWQRSVGILSVRCL